jgi:hypothetical protein
MTDRFTVTEQYHQCPVCRSGDIAAGGASWHGETMWVQIECEQCDATWEETFAFSHSDNLQSDGGALAFPTPDNGVTT